MTFIKAPSRRARPRYRVALGVLAAVATAGLWLAVRGSFFFADDWINLADARQLRLTHELLTRGYFGHFAPGHRVIDWALAWKFPAEWSAYLFFVLAAYVACIALFWTLLRELGVRPAVALAATTLFTVSTVWVRVIQWEASAAHIMPATLGTLAALAAAAAWIDRRRPWLLAVSVAGVTFGLLFYEKPVLVVGYVLLLDVFVLGDAVQPASIVARLRRSWPLYAAHSVLAVGYAVLVVAGGYSGTGPNVSVSVWLDYLANSWTRSVGGLVVGQGAPEYAERFPLALVVTGQLVLAGLVVASLARSRGAWRAWAFFVVVWFVNVSLVGIGRLGGFGAGIALDPRYYAELVFLLPLAVALAFSVAGTPLARPLPLSPSLLVPAAVVGLVLLVVSAADGYRTVHESWQGKDARAYADRVRHEAPGSRGADGVLSVSPGTTPFGLTTNIPPPYNQLATVLPILVGGRLAFDGSGAPVVVQDDGNLRAGQRELLVGGGLADLQRRGAARTLEDPSGAASDCRRAASVIEVVTGTQDVHVASRLELDASGATSGAAVEVRVDRGAGTGAVDALVVLGHDKPGAVEVPGGRLRAVLLTAPPGVCLQRIDLFSVR